KARILVASLGVCVVGACTIGRDNSTDPGLSGHPHGNNGDGDGSNNTTATAYVRTDVVSDQAGVALFQDTNLVNAWGIVPALDAFWIADNHSGLLSAFDGRGNAHRLNDKIMIEEGITGLVVNTAARDFMITCSETRPATFLVASESGKVWGVNPDLNAREGLVVIDNSAVGAIYKGIALTNVDNQ